MKRNKINPQQLDVIYTSKDINLLPEQKELPDLFMMLEGKRIQSMLDWKKRLTELKV